MKRQAPEFEKMFVTHITGKGLVSEISKEPIPVRRKTGKILEDTLHMKSALSFSHERNES